MPRRASSSLLDRLAGLVDTLLTPLLQPIRPTPVLIPVAGRRPQPLRVPLGRR